MNARWHTDDSSNVIGGSTKDIFVFGPFRLDATRRTIERAGAPLQLSDRAFDILLVLIRQAGTVVSKSDLIAAAWPDTSVDEGSLRVHVAALRKALLDAHAGTQYLSTISGRGYCFVSSVSRLEHEQPASIKAAPVHNLPAPPRRMVGREQAIQDICENLKRHRFITIVGPGGIGKTTVAVSVGHALLAAFTGQVHFVSLSEIRDAALVADITASGFGLPVRSNDPTENLAAFLRDKRVLLILDCCEHVIEKTAALAERLYKEAPELHILATSRELLRVEGEHTHRLLPLASPPEDGVLTAAGALAYPAVELFVERTIAGGHEFELTDANASDIGNLCRRLDGIPLAIELTAGHVGAYGIKTMVELLNKQFNLLWEGRRTALPRHRTLRATIEWSYNLLSESERVALSRLSVFVGSFSLEAAESVAGYEDAAGGDKMIATLAGLVTKSMLALNNDARSARYRLLDTTRAYAREKLAQSTEADAVARRHTSYFLELLEGLGEEQASVADQFGNIRAALTWCFSDGGDRRTGVALTAASIPLFFKLSLFTELQLWVTRAIEALNETGGSVRHDLTLHAALGSVRALTGQLDELAAKYLNRAIDLAEKIGDVPAQLRLIGRLHLLLLFVGRYDASLSAATRGEAIALANGDSAAVARMRILLGISCHYLGQLSAARAYTEAALLHSGRKGDVSSDPIVDYPQRAQITLARILWLQGYPDQATKIAREAISDVIATNNPFTFYRALPWAFGVFFWNGVPQECEEHMDRLVVEARRFNLSILQTIGQAMKGISLLARSETTMGLAMLRSSIERLQCRHYGAAAGLCVPLAEALVAAGRGDEALETIDQAIARARARSFLMDMSDMLRARAEVLMGKSNPDLLEAEHTLLEALELARDQGALGYELRAAISLARLWLRQGLRQEARDMLAPIYGRFNEGLDTRPLQTARELLAELNCPRSGSPAQVDRPGSKSACSSASPYSLSQS